MIKYIVGLLIIPLFSCGQTTDSLYYSEKEYVEKKRGYDDGYPFVIIYVNKRDTNYILKKNYFFDSTYNGNSFNKTFFLKNKANGPYISIIDGQIRSKGTYKGDKYEGERLSYSNGVLIQKAYFNSGIKVGKWEEYNDRGILINTQTFDSKNNVTVRKYDEKGNIVNTTSFDEKGRIIKLEEGN